MKTAQMLRKLRPSALLQLERHSAIRELVRPGSFTYEQLYTTRKGVSSLARKLSEAERRAMDIIIRCFACAPFDEPQLVKQAPPDYPGAELRVGLSGLRAAGIILTVRKSWGELLHALPADALGPWQLELYGTPDWQAADEQAEPEISALGRMDDDLFALLAYAGKNELTLTQRGAIHKRHVLALQRELQLGTAEPLQRMGFSYAHADAYDPGTAAVLDAALIFGLLAAERGALRLQRERLQAWLRLRRARRSRLLQAAWMERLWPAEPALQRAAAALEHAPRGAWLALPQLTAWLSDIAGGSTKQLDALIAAHWLEPLAALGWLELGRSTVTGEILLRLPMDVDAPEETGRWYVQPDFEIIVPPDIPADVRWELERFAERRTTDQVHIYELKKNSVWFGCEQGLTAAAMVQVITDHAMFDVPETIMQAIWQWAGTYGRTAIAQVTLLRCADAETAEQVKRIPKLLPLLLGQLGERDFIVPQGQLGELRTLLEKAGIAPRRALETPDASLQDCQFPSVMGREATADHPSGEADLTNVSSPGIWDDWAPSAAGLIYGTDSLAHLELAPDLPEHDEVLPDLKEIPAMWWKDYRAYHASTRKDMIRKAIEWKSLLKLRMEGRDRTVAPKRLHEESGEWSMIALESGREIRLAGDEWNEMKLLVPGHGDR